MATAPRQEKAHERARARAACLGLRIPLTLLLAAAPGLPAFGAAGGRAAGPETSGQKNGKSAKKEAARGRPVAWRALFQPARAPGQMHFRGRVVDDAGEHRLEVWRRGREALRQTIDDHLDTYLQSDGRTGVRVTVVDRTSHKVEETSAEALLTQGTLLDWDELAHALRKPWHGDELTALKRAPEKTALGPCRWHQLKRGQEAPVTLCWSDRWQLPLFIRDQSGRPQLTIEQVEAMPIPDAILTPPPGTGRRALPHEID